MKRRNVDVNVKNLFIKVDAIKDLFGILVILNDKPCDVREYLDYENCKCRKKLVDNLVEECNKNIVENEIISATLNDYESVYNSCTIYVVLPVISFLIIIGISSASMYFHWYLKKSNIGVININPETETVIY